MTTLIPFAKTPQQKLVTVDEVERGLACECSCPKCDAQMVAAKGEIRRHYFRHHNPNPNCYGAQETAIHLFAKQIIAERLELTLPCDLGNPIAALVEYSVGSVRPDVLLQYPGETVAVEIYVAHRVPREKVRTYAEAKQTAVEIDLSYLRHADLTEEEWIEAILFTADRYWLVPSKAEREREAQRRAAWIAEQKRLAQEAKIAMNQAHEALKERERELAAQDAQAEAELARIAVAEAGIEEKRKIQAAEALQKLVAEAKKREKLADLRKALNDQAERERKPPDLQALVAAHRTYSNIPPEAWDEWDRSVQKYQLMIRNGGVYERPDGNYHHWSDWRKTGG